jgi:anthranilate synthase component 2
MLLIIDNYDSFTYNLVQYYGELGYETLVKRNDEITLKEIPALKPSHIILSPGPCTPNEAGICLELIDTYKQSYPIFGVCLGHQAIGQNFGGKIIKAKQVMHGKISTIAHNDKGIFKNLPQHFNATRYHSLVVDNSSLPDCLEVIAWTTDKQGGFDEIMGIKHKEYPIEGVQFHPESILSEHGKEILNQFLITYK